MPTILQLEVRQDRESDKNSPERAHQPSKYKCDGVDVRPPLGVPTYFLHAVTVSLMFSWIPLIAVVPQKRPHSGLEVFSNLSGWWEIPGAGMSRSAISDAQLLDAEKTQQASSQKLCVKSPTICLDTAQTAVLPTSDNASSEESFTELFSKGVEDIHHRAAENLFSSQCSTILSTQDADPEKASTCQSYLHIPPFSALIDTVFRNLICARPIRTAPGTKIESSDLEARLIDIAPTTFSPEYAEQIAARAPFVPVVARFLTTFLQKSRSSPIMTKRDKLIQQFSKMNSTQTFKEGGLKDETPETLKEVVKTHLWMTLTNGLRDPELARRLKPLQPFRNPSTALSYHSLDIENATNGCDELRGTTQHEMLQEDKHARFGPTCRGATDNEEMLDTYEEEEIDDYECDLFEEYEDRWNNNTEHANAEVSDTINNDRDYHAQGESVLDDSALHSSSPMLELEEELTRRAAAKLVLSIESEQILGPSSATTLVDAVGILDTTAGEPERNLLDDESPPGFQASSVHHEYLARSSPMIEDELEPDFQQWEHDVEDFRNDLLF